MVNMNKQNLKCLYIFIKLHKEKVRLLAIKALNEKYPFLPYCDECEKGDKDEKCYEHRNYYL